MSSKTEVEKTNTQYNLSMVMQKMSNTLTALGKAFDQVIDLQDPMDQTHHEIGKATDIEVKKRETMDL